MQWRGQQSLRSVSYNPNYGILLYSRDEIRRVEFETSLRSAYFDYQPAEQMIRQAFLEHVKDRGLRG